jgi:hypothetical protein
VSFPCCRCLRDVSGSFTRRGTSLDLGVALLVREVGDGQVLEGIGFSELGRKGGLICRACLREIVDGPSIDAKKDNARSATAAPPQGAKESRT